MARASRRHAYEAEQRRLEESRRGGESPFRHFRHAVRRDPRGDDARDGDSLVPDRSGDRRVGRDDGRAAAGRAGAGVRERGATSAEAEVADAAEEQLVDEPVRDARRDGHAQRRQRRVRGRAAGRADDLRRRRRDGEAQAGGPRHRRPDARAPRRRRALRDRVERHPAARPARRRQDVLRARDRRRVRDEPDARLDRRPRRVARGRLGPEHRQGVRDGAAEPAVPALLRRVRLGRAAPRQHPRPGVASHGQPAADLARGLPRRARAAGDGGDELDRAPRSRRDPARPLRPSHQDRPSRCRRASSDLRGRARRPPRRRRHRPRSARDAAPRG